MSDLALLRRFRQDADPASRDELVRRLTPAAMLVARRYAHGREPLEDLVQVAQVAVMKALTRFDPALGRSLRAYAVPLIHGEVRHHLRDHSRSVHVPASIQARASRVRATAARLRANSGSPEIATLARRLGLDEATVRDTLAAEQAADTVSLDDLGEAGTGSSRLANEDPGLRAVEDRAALTAALSALKPVERHAILLRVVGDRSWEEIGEALGYSASYSSRLVRGALDRITL